MSFVGSMFDSSKGAGFQAQKADLDKVFTQQQIDRAYGNTQSGLSQQQAFVNALQAQNGIQNQSNVYNQLGQVAAGQGPNPARAMLAQATGANTAQQAALMGSQRGAGANVGLIARQAAQQGGANQQNLASQAAVLQANQSLGALGQMGGLASQQVGQQQQGIGAYNQFAQGQQQNLLNAAASYNQAQAGQQNAMNMANAQIAGINTQGQAQILGGLLSGAGSAASGGAGGGGGGMAHGGIIPGYADGGEIDPMQSAQPRSAAARFMKGFQQGSGMGTQPGMFQAGQGIAQGIGAGIQGVSNLFSNPSSESGGMPELDLSQPLAHPQDVITPERNFVPPLAHGGKVHDMKRGGKVPGHAQVSGDSYTNDTVPAMLSPKEIVIPRSISMHPNAGELAKQFVEQELRKNKHYAEGGEVEKGNQPTININVPQAQGPQPLPESVNVNPNFMQGPQLASNKKLPQNQFAEEYQPKYSYDPQGAPIEAQPQQPSSRNLNLGLQRPQAQPGVSPLEQLPGREVYEQPVETKVQALQAEAQAKGELGQRQAQAAGQYIGQQQAQQRMYQNNLASNMQEVDAAVQDYKNGHIQPNRYLANQNVGQKIATAIGLVLGGIGGALTHQENPALKFLQSQIDRDIESQKAELGKKENLLSANFRKFGNMQDAVRMTQAMQHGIYAAQFEKAAALAQSPIEKQRAMAAAQDERLKIAPLVAEAGLRKSLISQGTQGQPGLGGGGQNQTALDAFRARYLAPKGKEEQTEKDLKEFQDLKEAKKSALQAFDKANAENTFFNRNIAAPIQTKKRVGALIEPVIAETAKFSVNKFTEADQQAIRHAMDTTNADPSTVAIQRRALANLYEKKMHFPSLIAVGINTKVPEERTGIAPAGFETARK